MYPKYKSFFGLSSLAYLYSPSYQLEEATQKAAAKAEAVKEDPKEARKRRKAAALEKERNEGALEAAKDKRERKASRKRVNVAISKAHNSNYHYDPDLNDWIYTRK